MKFQRLNIATARIEGLEKPPYYDNEHFCFYGWDIMFRDASYLMFNNLFSIKMGNFENEAEIFCNQIKNNFKEADIHEGDEVAVMFDDDGKILAIGRTGKGVWIDVTDKFSKKTFSQLNIVPTSLKVY